MGKQTLIKNWREREREPFESVFQNHAAKLQASRSVELWVIS